MAEQIHRLHKREFRGHSLSSKKSYSNRFKDQHETKCNRVTFMTKMVHSVSHRDEKYSQDIGESRRTSSLISFIFMQFSGKKMAKIISWHSQIWRCRSLREILDPLPLYERYF